MLHESKLKTVVWYTTVGLLVFFAIVFTIFRLVFSSVPEYQNELELMAGEYLGLPVEISGMDARVVGLSPTVILTDLSLLEEEGGEPLTRFKSVEVAFKPLVSLQKLKPIIELTVSGTRLEIVRERDNSFAVHGFEIKRGAEDLAGTNKGGEKSGVSEEEQLLGEWFLSQTRLAVKDTQISLLNEKTGEHYQFDNVELELSNSEQRHRLNGYVELPATLGQRLQVAIDVEGDPISGAEWSGDVYAQVEQVNLRQNLTQLSWAQGELRSGLFNAELWSHLDNGELQTVRARASGAGILLAQEDKKDVLEHLSLDAQLQLYQSGWKLDVAEMQLHLPDSDAMPMRFSITRDDKQNSLIANNLQLAPLSLIARYVPGLSEENRAMIEKMAPAGTVTELHAQQAVGGAIKLAGKAEDLSLSAWKKLPGVNGLDAHVQYAGNDALLSLSSRDMELDLPRLFRDPLSLDMLETELRLHRNDAGWQVETDSVKVKNSDLAGEVAMSLYLAEDAPPWLSLQGRFRDGNARSVPNYLPAGIMSSGSLRWLDKAFLDGRVVKGRMQYHGQVDHFPFSQHRGRFEVLFDTEAVQLHYQDGWPDLHQLTGEVHFDGPGMSIAASGARVFGATVGETAVSIPSFRGAQLLVEGGAQFPAEDGLHFLRQSPLSEKAGEALQNLKAEGEASLSLQLAIPLSASVRETKPLRVNGRVDFSGNQLNVWDEVTFKEINGSLDFTEKVFSADGIQARLAERPVSVTVDTGGRRLGSLDIVAKGRSDLSLLSRELDIPFADNLNGETSWQASLEFSNKSSQGPRLQLVSDLQGVASTLPVPLAKSVEDKLDMQMELYLGGSRRGERSLSLGERMGLAWQQDSEGRLQRARLKLGDGSAPRLPAEKSIEVVGRSDKLSLEPWRALLKPHEGKGKAKPLPIKIDMERLQLVSGSGKESGFGLSSYDIPMLSVAIKQFSYDELDLGSVSFNSQQKGKYLLFNDIHIHKAKRFDLSGKGNWSRGGKSRFNLKLKSPDMGRMLRHFGFASVIKGGDTRVSGTVWWPGDPMAFSLAGLNAQMGVSIKDGTIVEVDPGAGRMLGILSLSALPRRLFLDFSDVFKKGLNFKSIKGDLAISNGQVNTKNLRLESGLASILVTGRTGLVEQDFEQDVYVVPNVSDTTTVASALAWGPQVAAVVALFQNVFKKDIEEATMTQYHITGKWDQPKIERINKPKPTGEDNEADVFPFEN